MPAAQVVRGIVRHVGTALDQTEHVLSFRVEQTDDLGTVKASIQAELRSLGPSPRVVDGDEVEITGTPRPDGVLRVQQLLNLSTSVLTRSAGGGGQRLIAATFLIPFIGGAIGFAVGRWLPGHGLGMGGIATGFIAGGFVQALLFIVMTLVGRRRG